MVSIIVPVYRAEKTLRRCVESVLAQTYTDWELILVDDGSPDGSGALCEEIVREQRSGAQPENVTLGQGNGAQPENVTREQRSAARQVRRSVQFPVNADGECSREKACARRILVLHKENGGVSSARNAGMEAVHGEFLFFLDSDDAIVPEALQIMMAAQQAYDADMVYGGIAYRYETALPDRAEKRGERKTLILEQRKLCFYPNARAMRDDYAKRYVSFEVHHASGTLYRRGAVAALCFSERLTMGEDLAFNLQVLAAARGIVFLRERVYFYYKNKEQSATMQYDAHKVEKAKAVHALAVQGARRIFGEQYVPLAENAVLAGDVVRAAQRLVQRYPDKKDAARVKAQIRAWVEDEEVRQAAERMYTGTAVYWGVRWGMRRKKSAEWMYWVFLKLRLCYTK